MKILLLGKVDSYVENSILKLDSSALRWSGQYNLYFQIDLDNRVHFRSEVAPRSDITHLQVNEEAFKRIFD